MGWGKECAPFHEREPREVASSNRHSSWIWHVDGPTPKQTTLQVLSMGNYTRPDNVFVSTPLINYVVRCYTSPPRVTDKNWTHSYSHWTGNNCQEWVFQSDKSKIGRDWQEKTSQMIIKEKFSKSAVMKDNGLRWVFLPERRITPKGT